MWSRRLSGRVMQIEVHEGRDSPKLFLVGKSKVLVHFSEAILNAWFGVPRKDPLNSMPNSAWDLLIDSVQHHLNSEANEGRLENEYEFSISQLQAMKKAKENAH